MPDKDEALAFARQLGPSIKKMIASAVAEAIGTPGGIVGRGLARSEKEALIESVGAFVATRIGEKLAPLEARLAELEARPTLRYVGVWERGINYGIGAFATHHGSLWPCNTPTDDEPGTSKNWTLTAKKGRDAR